MKTVYQLSLLLTSLLVIYTSSAYAEDALPSVNARYTIGYKYDLPPGEKELFYSIVAASDLSDNFSANLLVTADSDRTKHYRPQVQAVAISYSNTIKDCDYSLSVGSIIVPLGLYEYQRVLPTTIQPRLLDDSFYLSIVNDAFFDYTNTGAILRLTYSKYEFLLGLYAPKDLTYRISIAPTSAAYYAGLLGNPTTFDPRQPINLNRIQRIVLGAVIDRNSDATLTQLQQEPDKIEYNINRQSVYIGTKVDAEKFIATAETVLNFNKVKGYGENIIYNDVLANIGFEYNVAERLFVANEYFYYTNTLAKTNDYGVGLGFAYDSDPMTYTGSVIKTKGSNASTLEYNIGATYAFDNGLYIKLNYRNINASYASQNGVVTSDYCDSVCVALTETTNVMNKSSMPQINYDDAGIEFRILFNFK